MEGAIEFYDKREIAITDQGSQFTYEVFTNLCFSNDIKLVVSGNAVIKGLWKGVKYKGISTKIRDRPVSTE